MATKQRLIDAHALKEKDEPEEVTGEGIVYVQDIDEAPTIEARPVVHGRWEEWWPGISLIMTGEEMLYRCSVCDAKYPDIEGYNYCPNCGADMRGDHTIND